MASSPAQNEPNLSASTPASADPLLTLGAAIIPSPTFPDATSTPSTSQVTSDTLSTPPVAEANSPAPLAPSSERVVSPSSTAIPTSHSSAVPSSSISAPNTESTLTQNAGAESPEQSTAKKASESAVASTSTPSPVSTLPAAPSPASPIPKSSAPTPSSTKPPVASASIAPAKSTQKKKKKSLLATIFPCFSDSSAHDEPKPTRPTPSSAGVGEKKPAVPVTPSKLASSTAVAAVTVPPSNEKSFLPVVEEHKESPVMSVAGAEEVSRSGKEPKERDLAQTGVSPEGPSTSRQAEPLRVDTLAAALPSAGNDGEVIIPSHEPITPPMDETAGLTSSSVVPPGSGSHLLPHTPPSPSHHHTNTPNTPAESHHGHESYAGDSENEQRYEGEQGTEGERSESEEELEEEEEDEEFSLLGGVGIPVGPDGQPCPLLPPMAPHHKGRKCLVLDLDETLLHSSFKMIPQSDFIVPVEIESQTHNVYVIKRPGVDEFMRRMGEIYEVVIFTASLSKYADPVLDMLDIHGVVAHRLFRESCYNHKGNYVKDLSQLGRPIDETIIIDNSPASYIFHPNNAVPVSTWFNDPHDAELSDLINFLADLAQVEDVRGVLDGGLM